MKPGNVVEFVDGDEHRLGAVIDVIGKVKLLVLTSTGDEQRPERDAVTFTFAGNFDRGDRTGALRALAGVEERVRDITESLDIEALWNAAAGGAAHDIDSLASLTGQRGGMVKLALARCLREDDVYFRVRKGRYTARTADQVEERFRQLEEEAGHQAQRDTFVSALAAVFELPRYQRADAFKRLAQTGDFASWTELLHGYAADEEGHPRREEAEALLDDLDRAADLRLTARANPRGFELMVELGLWTEHEVTVLHKFGVREEFAPDILAAAEARRTEGFRRDGREDFTGWWTITIDAATSRDLDDALSIRPRLDGGWELAVHIADPDAYAPIDSPLDKAACERAATVYLPDRTIDMFPPDLSHGAMSLVQGSDRPAMTTHVQFDSDLEIESFRFTPSIVNVNRRLTYDKVDEMLESSSNDHLSNVVRDLAFIADELHASRLARGARAIELPEPEVEVDLEEDPPEIEFRRQDPSTSRSLVAEFMVLVGELTAKWCVERNVPLIFRRQAPPHGERDDREIQQIPEGWGREFAVLKTMQRGDVGVQPGPHAALGIDAYAQATSPIRRYSDLVVQRQVKASIEGAPPPYDQADLQRIAHQVEEAVHQANTAQHEATTYWLLESMHQREGEVVEAVILGRRDDPRRAEVMLVESGFRTQARVRVTAEVGTTVQLRIDRARPRPPVVVLEQV